MLFQVSDWRYHSQFVTDVSSNLYRESNTSMFSRLA